MNIEDVYTKIEEQLDQNLPFVVYRKADSMTLHAIFQKNNQIYEVEDYTVSGFVFAPFSASDKTVIIPSEKSNYCNATISSQTISSEKRTSGKLADSFLVKPEIKKKHVELVKKGIKAIQSDRFKKVVLSRKEEVSIPNSFSNLHIFKNLIHHYPKAFVYLWYHPKVSTWMGATPETLIRVKNNDFFTMALAGTQSYINTTDVDWGEKELVEQEMVTSFVTNELSSIINNIKHSKTYTHKAGTLLHLRTDISGVLGNENSRIEKIIKVLHPTPAVCGLPKGEAKSFILATEEYNRKYYTGFLGELNMNKEGVVKSDLFVNLRCMELSDGKAILYVGGGITKDSDPEKEWEETVKKTETMKRVLF
ncbi:isochorismate synthase [Aquimarina sp. MAR_2010_214]|uniref:chorismate-binding protein n=1 Tax=Aquimarina sp. MAR_2010_214 TaxID=1250026 RepID=UPI000C702680|nr:chorismate-binding protein [Aquimarina sp. MAR_2010_214]PKV51094.1 isochorismate synthase [Aquimarina sp. MAR_2010_214]